MTTNKQSTQPPLPTTPRALSATAVADRRRSHRRQLHEPTDVQLFGTGVQDTWRVTATLLNASVDGVACRITEKEAKALRLGETIRAVFTVGESTETYDWRAHITNITRGATSGYVILGMEFIASGRTDAERKRLQHALALAGAVA